MSTNTASRQSNPAPRQPDPARLDSAPAQRIPAPLYGRRRSDLLMGTLSAILHTRLGWIERVHRHAPPAPENDRRIEVVVTERRIEARDNDVVGIRFAAPDGGELPAWMPGAHLDVELPSGRLRQYSLCGDPRDANSYRIAVRRIPDGGGGSREVHEALTPGTRVTIRGPRNAFPFVPPGNAGTRVHFVAGGIGITPILPMVRAAARAGSNWTLIYTGRAADTLPFLRELGEFGDRVTVRTDDIHGLPDATALLGGVGPGAAVYCCGPAAMTATITDALRHRPEIALYSERFSAPPVVDGKPFDVVLARTGETVEVAADRTILESVLAVRPDTAYSCRQGFCRTCLVRTLDGEPEHRDTALTPDERAEGDILICVSRCAGGRLVLDL
ncbi:PDR/VanB family oxidoreductase [Nocardia sp. NPDC005978]|uniref:PDR/VanB family oxidoreductase n=1 Tax=Nocardia sp. NPDC005978 TaxID=3156725 RepID=UPI0033AD2B8F